jgi:hypothetical protein
MRQVFENVTTSRKVAIVGVPISEILSQNETLSHMRRIHLAAKRKFRLIDDEGLQRLDRLAGNQVIDSDTKLVSSWLQVAGG